MAIDCADGAVKHVLIGDWMPRDRDVGGLTTLTEVRGEDHRQVKAPGLLLGHRTYISTLHIRTKA